MPPGSAVLVRMPRGAASRGACPPGGPRVAAAACTRPRAPSSGRRQACWSTVDPLHDLTLPAILAEHRRSHPTRLAAVCGTDRFTWPEFDDRVAGLAGALRRDRVGVGDRVLWLGQNCHRVLELLLAAGRVGAVLCPANWRQSAAELAFVIDDLEPRVVVWQEQEIGEVVRAARVRSTGAATARWLSHDAEGDATYEDYRAAADPLPVDAVAVDPSWPVLLLYTAAFDGTPNGALLSHAGIIAQK